MQLRKAARIILVGAPGVGKGTQSERMLKRFPQLASISSGDLLRDNVRRRTPLGTVRLSVVTTPGIQAESLMKAGSLVPDSTILRLITNELTTRGWLTPSTTQKPLTVNSVASSLNPLNAFAPAQDEYITPTSSYQGSYDFSDQPSASFILDGFPRTVDQAIQLDRLVPINLVVQLNTPTSVILDRICNRWIHAASGRVYNTTFNAPKVDGKDDITGEALIQRDDDKPETWMARLKKFEETSLPLLEHYDKLGVLWKVDGNSSDEISPKLFDEFNKRFGLA
ncbi:adenylate kinase [Aureobasidium pullulans]|uniref:GTP:AMP phosphotransferase, mitochondrial n=1 Tax=Aureobasidium pullulans TaxID=5580 RepID=A0A4S8ZRT0_AURPU|nr:adenylate kinase [Aureobasidium pullulans]THW68995.1 adenylate kinase [Aureobasidium pullulans]THX84202.1 adenylate kinase [Aureobasidium pullulans]THY09991.1 adenylate kinase [Aureobasidium pullulans]THY65640.1 adenylate kinase [Aureobasidium pullulans]